MTPPGQEPEDNAVLAAIAADHRLTARQRKALAEIYESFVASSPRPSERRLSAGAQRARPRSSPARPAESAARSPPASSNDGMDVLASTSSRSPTAPESPSRPT